MLANVLARPADFSYLGLRETIGWVGIIMPIAVWTIGSRQGLDPSVYDTVSAHYYSWARDLFVGSMALIGALIYFYRAPNKIDTVVAKITGIAGILIGIMPMAHKPAMNASNDYTLIQNLHFYPVTLFFLGGIYLVIFSFKRISTDQISKGIPTTLTQRELDNIRKRTLRNQIYFFCGIIMIIGGIVLGLANILDKYFTFQGGWRYYPETAMIASFATAWLIKGQTFAFIRDQ